MSLIISVGTVRREEGSREEQKRWRAEQQYEKIEIRKGKRE